MAEQDHGQTGLALERVAYLNPVYFHPLPVVHIPACAAPFPIRLGNPPTVYVSRLTACVKVTPRKRFTRRQGGRQRARRENRTQKLFRWFCAFGGRFIAVTFGSSRAVHCRCPPHG